MAVTKIYMHAAICCTHTRDIDIIHVNSNWRFLHQIVYIVKNLSPYITSCPATACACLEIIPLTLSLPYIHA